MSRRASISEAAMSRALKAAKAAGVIVARIDIDLVAAKISIFTPSAPSMLTAENDLDRELAAFEARHDQG